ncbi:MAG: benzodiazapine receptor [Alteromonas naphthalenivorans]|jgi:benzodiazapine receptor
MISRNYKSLIFFIIITFFGSFIGRMINDFNKEPWYSSICKSNFTPPGWVFGIVWPILYLLMALAIWIAYCNNPNNKKTILKLYFIQLILNGSWTPIFFGMHSILGGLIIIIALIVSIVILMHEYYPKQMISFYLMIPYLGWCCFALFLNFTLYLLN